MVLAQRNALKDEYILDMNPFLQSICYGRQHDMQDIGVLLCRMEILRVHFHRSHR